MCLYFQCFYKFVCSCIKCRVVVSRCITVKAYVKVCVFSCSSTVRVRAVVILCILSTVCSSSGQSGRASVKCLQLQFCSKVYCCALRLWSQICVTCRSYWFPDLVDPVLLCRGKMPRARGKAAYVRDGYRAFQKPKFVCGCCEMLVFRVCVVRQNLYVFSLYCNPNLDERIFDYLLTSMAAVQAEDVPASFLFVGDLNGYHQEWLGSTTTNRYGVAAFDFASLCLRSIGCRPNPCMWWNT